MSSSEKPPHSRRSAPADGESGDESASLRSRAAFRARAALGPRTRTTRQLGSIAAHSPAGAPRLVRDFTTVRRSGLFDGSYYLERYPEVARSGFSPLLHYLEHGAAAGFDPSASFSTDRYVESHPELISSGENPLAHLVRHLAETPGEAEETGRRVQRPAELGTSVIVLAEGGIEELSRTLQSVLSQSRSAFEVLVSDERDDGTVQAFLETRFAEALRSESIRRLGPEPARGHSARNVALRAAQGEATAYLPAGSAWEQQFLAKMTEALAAGEPSCTILCDPGRDPAIDGGAAAYARLLSGHGPGISAFVHLGRLHDQLGGFDEELAEAAETELIVRYARCYPPLVCGEPLIAGGEPAEAKPAEQEGTRSFRNRIAHERIRRGLVPLRLAYVLWDFPALSQSFVLAEIGELIGRGYDVRVYYREAPEAEAVPDFEVPSRQVSSQGELAKLLLEDERTFVHAHFAHPAAAGLAWPAARAAGLPFTLTVHAVDIFHRENRERNQIAEMTADELCARVFAVGSFHRDFLIGNGVEAEKISIVRPAADLEEAPPEAIEARLARPRRVVACIARLVEKKGVADLIRAAALLGEEAEVRIYGYGPLEDEYRALSEELGAGAVSFEGALENPRAVSEALAAADVFALPCIRDSDEDMDGLPTVIGEAMAAGVPVVTTDLAAIGEVVEHRSTGLIVPGGDPKALAAAIGELLGAEAETLRPIVEAAQERAAATWSAARTVDALLDCWERPPLEIGLVTYSRGDHGDAATTAEIIRRIYELTTTPFELRIVDNASEPTFAARLQLALAGRRNARLTLLPENRDWGPALNLAWRDARGEQVIYVCSNEGFVLQPGWERAFVEHLRAHREVAIAGHPISSPAFPKGRDYAEQPWFRGFRNPLFARDNLEREFSHVQGGLFAVRRSAFESSGGFSDTVTHAAADIEYSYLLESLGWRLGSVAEAPSLTVKTRPGLDAHIDESTVAAHPLSLDSVESAARVANGETAFCNVCGWTGAGFAGEPDRPICPECESTPFGRLVFRYVANSPLPFRGLDCAAEIGDAAVTAHLERMFTLTSVNGGARSNGDAGPDLDLVIADLERLDPSQALSRVETIGGALSCDGLAILSVADNDSSEISDALGEAGFEVRRVSMPSQAVRFPPQGLIVASRS